MRYGVIGTGMMGIEHINNLLQLPGARVTAIADPHEQSRAWAQLAVGLDTPLAAFESHQELLASGLCDAVVIATPNFTHHEVLLDVLRTPHHVMVEKPLCTTVPHCLEAIEVATSTSEQWPDRVVWMGLEYRYMPPTAAVLHEVRGGAVGTVQMVAIREHRFPFLPKVGNWNRFNRNTGGTLVEKCCHFFDLMNLLVGATPVRVMASGAQDVNHLDERYDGETPDILDNAYVIVEYEGGARAVLDLCMFAEATKNEQEISVVGPLGKVEAMVGEGIVRLGRRADGMGHYSERPVHDPAVLHTGMHHGASYLEHVDFADAIRTGVAASVTLHDGLMSVAIGVAAHRSIAEGRPVTIREVLGG
ncbi:MAG: gfo/Idh/MocA family oxidoreductase [Actinobacteria bacterium]|nr:gfo/Idh/MocA family oxidoreductase [Actinomycetota bacterium]MSW78864.1 gfo/Idh/MocA family oxidoreductase [Actinomycetota bacterium]MSX56012.1 gfo/Idh/MocA family oxidoreductase [Actinomycetota bacterium]MSX93142.1 gfo/Idh/MocA family oxidoreductase [Actinomycetota bacterium]MSZ84432.1 gfo/Idh/MocA family oxidoreductase [Actinomycetota bacterium]